MATGIEYAPRQSETEQITAHVLWMTIAQSRSAPRSSGRPTSF
jgi:hypothetical protein